MKRFTQRNSNGEAVCRCVSANSLVHCTEIVGGEAIEYFAELEDKIESGQLVELPVPFIEESENADGETTYLVYRSKVETYCPSEDVFTDKLQAEARLKELLEEVNDI